MFDKKEYEKELKTIDIEEANKLALKIMIPLFVLFTLLHVILWKDEIVDYYRNEFSFISFITNFGLFFIALFVGIVLHELIHGVIFAIFAEGGFKSIKFGIIKKHLTPYCHCSEPLKVKHYILGALAPALILGVIPLIIGLVLGKYLITFLGLFFFVAASGDFMIVYLLRNESPSSYVQDHPSEAGCFVYRKREV